MEEKFLSLFQENITGEERKMDVPPNTKTLKSDGVAAVAKTMKGLVLPGDKKNLVEQAKKNQALKEISELFNEIFDKNIASCTR